MAVNSIKKQKDFAGGQISFEITKYTVPGMCKVSGRLHSVQIDKKFQCKIVNLFLSISFNILVLNRTV